MNPTVLCNHCSHPFTLKDSNGFDLTSSRLSIPGGHVPIINSTQTLTLINHPYSPGGNPDDSVIRHAHTHTYIPRVASHSTSGTGTTISHPTTSLRIHISTIYNPWAMATPTPVPSRTDLAKKASRYRLLANLVSWLDRYLSFPLPPRPALQLTIPSTVSKHPGAITLYFFTATGTLRSPGEDEEAPHTKRPLLINFHGGGFAIGHPLDDARWIGAVLGAHRDAVVVSVGYRLGPEHPFPIPMEDGVDAVIWLWEHAGQYQLDRGRFVLCGASAGGNICLIVPLRLREELVKRRERVGEAPGIKLAGLIGFYPSTDWSRSRIERDATNPIASKKSMIWPEAFRFFDESYLMPENLPRKVGASGEIDMCHPYVSPGLAPEGLILAAYPGSLAIYTCGWDQLLVEGNVFRERLRGMVGPGGLSHVGGMVIEDVIHGFDKKPSFFLGNAARDRMYGDAVRQLEVMWKEGRAKREREFVAGEGSELTIG